MQKMLFFLVILIKVSSVYYNLPTSKEKCFLLDIPKSIVILGTYDLLDPVPEDFPKDGISLKVLDERQRKVYSTIFRGPGKFSFTSQSRGQHRACLITTPGQWIGSRSKVRVLIKLDHYQNAEIHSEVAKKEQFEHIGEILDGINDRVEDLIKVQEYAMDKEVMFKDESEEISWRIIFFTFFQTGVIFLSGVWQIWNLRRFFIERKIITR